MIAVDENSEEEDSVNSTSTLDVSNTEEGDEEERVDSSPDHEEGEPTSSESQVNPTFPKTFLQQLCCSFPPRWGFSYYEALAQGLKSGSERDERTKTGFSDFNVKFLLKVWEHRVLIRWNVQSRYAILMDTDSESQAIPMLF